MKLYPFLFFLFFTFNCFAQYKTEIISKDTVFLNEPFMVSYRIEGWGDQRKNIELMKFERVSSEGLIQLNEKLFATKERIIRDTLSNDRQMGYLFVPSHPGFVTLPMGRFTGPDTVKVLPKEILVLGKKISPEDSLKRITSRQLLFRTAKDGLMQLPDPATLVMKTRVSNNNPSVGEEFTVSWEINTLMVTPVIPAREELEKHFTIVGGPVNKGTHNNENPTGRTKLEYIIKANKPGKYKIKGATATVSGKQLKSEVVEVTVK